MLGLGAGGGINDEEAGLAGGNIDGVDGAERVFDAGLVVISFLSFRDVSLLFNLSSSWSLVRENEGTASFNCVGVDLGVASSCSVSSGSETWNDGASSFVLVLTSFSLESCCSSACGMSCVFDRSHGGKALRVATG